MNVYEWMGATESEPPLHEDDSREDPGHHPQVPTEDDDDTNRQHHGDGSPAGGGRSTNDDNELHCTEHTIQDPQMMEDLTHSQESIIESVRKVLKLHNRGSNYFEFDGNTRATALDVGTQIENTWANKDWVAKQSQVKHAVKVEDLFDKINPDKLIDTIKETAAINTQLQNAQLEAIIKAYTALKPAYDIIDKAGKPTDEAYDKFKELLATTKPMSEIFKGTQRVKASLLGQKTEGAREPLSPEEAVALGELVAKEMKNAWGIWSDGAKSIEQLIPALTLPAFERMQHDASGLTSKSYNEDAWVELYHAVVRKLGLNGMPIVQQAYRQFSDACIGAIVYMERSFTGGKEVSKEEFTVPMEGIIEYVLDAEGTVSNEAFGSIEKKLSGFFRHKPKDLTVEGDHNYQNAKKLIGATFMNDSWLKQQSFSDKPVKVSFPGNLTKFDHSIIDTIRSDSKEHKAKGKQFLDDGFKPVNEVIGYLFAHGWEKDPAHADRFLKEADFKFHAKHPEIEIAKPSVKQTLPALDKRSIKKIAQTFLDLVELKKELWDEHLLRIWKTFGVEGKHYEKGGKRYREADATNAPPSVYKMFEKLHKYGEDFEAAFYEYNQAYTRILQPTADGLLKWLTHSLTEFKAPK